MDTKISDNKSLLNEIEKNEITIGNGGKLAELEKTLEQESNVLERYRTDAEEIFKEFNCVTMGLDERYLEIRDHYKEIQIAQTELSRAQKELEEFLKDKNEEKLIVEIQTDVSIEELEKKKAEIEAQRVPCIQDISDINNRITSNEAKAEALSDYEGELKSCEEEKDRLSCELNMIKKTIDFLQQANDNLANRYLLPLQDKTREMMKVYDSEKSLEFNKDFKVLVNEKGKSRELEHFSKGIKELISICMRIALIDVIFHNSQQKPFIILDDPFVNLDDKKLVQAKDFIKRLSDNYQILYLTCHESRKIAL